MKLKISDMMDDLPCIPVEIGEKEFVTASRIRAQTMQRLHAEAAQGKPVRRISGVGLAAAVIAAALCVSATAAVVAHKWPGFVFTGSMSEAEKDRMLEETSVIHAMEQIDTDGTVHYFGEDGREELVLSAEEAAAYQQQQIAAHDRAVCQSTTLVDVSTMPFIPNSVTELAVDADGHFAEFAFGNAHMVLLYPKNSTGFDLRTGDTVTISLDADARGSLGFGLFKDGIYVSEEVVSAQGHLYTFKIEEDGRYCFFVENCSAGMYICTDGSLTVN